MTATHSDRLGAAGPAVGPAAGRAARRAPGRFVAGGATAGIKASGRPDLAVIATVVGPTGGCRPPPPRSSRRTRSRPRPVRLSRAHLAATAPEGDGRYGWVDGLVSTSGSANAATGAAGDADQAAIAAAFAAALGIRAGSDGRLLHRDHRHAPAAGPGPARDRPDRRRRPGGQRREPRGGRRGAPDDRLADQDGDDHRGAARCRRADR